MKKKVKVVLALLSAAGILTVAGISYSKFAPEKINSDFSVSYDGIKMAQIKAGASVHDPSIIQADGKYYIFGSHMTEAYSEDLRSWTYYGNGYSKTNPIFANLFDSTAHVFDYAGSKKSIIPTDDHKFHVWAPDVIFNKALQKYFMYFCTSSTWNASNLCYATSDQVQGPYTWQGALICSGFTQGTIDSTDVLDYVNKSDAEKNYITKSNEYNFNEYPNAIDPTAFYDKDGKMWMVYGSWSGGIFLLQLDEKTGKVIHPAADADRNVDAYFGKRLIGGGHKSIEGPYILYDPDSDYYYLYVSYGSLTREGGYQIRVFRSKTVNGDYTDMKGQSPQLGSGDHSSFGLKMSGNYFLPGLEKAYMATGHNSAMIDADNNKKYICYHTRFDNGSENHEPRVKQYFLNQEGWPCMLPYATAGETIADTGYDLSEITGEYYVINQGTGIDKTIAEPIKLVLSKKGKVYGKNITGTWTRTKGSYYMTLTYDAHTYSGIFCKMQDEAGTPVMTFSAVGENESIWGVRY